ncbi:MAG: hypothetical protein ACLFQX_08195 [Candidatus Kapaibacterium sp.]
MALNEYLEPSSSGFPKRRVAISTSSGAADASKIPATNSEGKIDETFFPAGIGSDSISMTASESLSAGDFVNVFNDSGTPKVRKADGSQYAKRAVGFVKQSASIGSPVTVYFEGTNDSVSGLSTGEEYFLSVATPGEAVTPHNASSANHIVQLIGRAISTTAISFEPDVKWIQ